MVSKNKTLMQYSVNATIYQVLVNRFQHINIKKQIYIFNHADLARNRWILQERLSWMQIAHARERGRKSEKESIRKENIDGISYWLWRPTINSGSFFRPAFGFHDQLYSVCFDSGPTCSKWYKDEGSSVILMFWWSCYWWWALQ
jgi:hypothetical protein